jgi:nitrogen fixation protein FixH
MPPIISLDRESAMSNAVHTLDQRSPRQWTGWTVLMTLLVFFGVIFAVNGIMIYAALSTLTGTDTDSAYQAGLQYEQEVAQAQAQDARHWQIDAKLTPSADGERVDLSARDATGRPLAGLDASVTFERPTDRRLDRSVVLVEDGAGRFHGSAELAAGQWDLVIELTRRGAQMFLSKNRVILK